MLKLARIHKNRILYIIYVRKKIPDSAINAIARYINEKSNKEFHIPVIGNENNLETPQVFEIIPFDQIDHSKRRFYAIDGSYNSEQFYNGLSVGIYSGGYICFQEGKKIRIDLLDDPIFKSQDKTLISVHYARIADRELSDRDKQKMFSYTYKVRILGTFTDNGTTVNFTTAVRKLPTVSYIARHLNQREISSILNKTNEQGVEIGHLCIGEDIADDKSLILFEIGKLRSKRTMVFAQSGFGKTNLVKVILYHMARDTSYGKLIFDLNGEYFLKGTRTYGLGDIDDNKIRNNVVVYTDKKLPEKYTKQNRFIYGGKVALNMHKNMSVGDILNFGAGFSDVMKSFLSKVYKKARE